MNVDGNKNMILSTINVAIKGMNWNNTSSCHIKLEHLTFDIFTEYVLSLRPKKKKKNCKRGGKQGITQQRVKNRMHRLCKRLEKRVGLLVSMHMDP